MVTVTVFVKEPTLAALYVALMIADLPGAIESFGKSVAVQPHEPWTLVIITSVLPVFVNSNDSVWMILSGILINLNLRIQYISMFF